MNKISCRHELCAADHQHDTTLHYRVTSDEGEPYRVLASWLETEAGTVSARVEMTYGGSTVVLTPHEATVWARVLVAGVAFGHTASLAVDLGTAIEVLSLLDEDGASPEFGSLHLSMSVDRAVARIFEDDDEKGQQIVLTLGDRS